MDIPKTYQPQEFEKDIYEFWLKNKYFHAEPNPDKKPFTIVLPPPNITGQLHMGHALNHTLQDILIRYKRMQGFETLWLPGTDHASIATEVKIVEAMRKEGLSKEEVGREGFLKRAWAWKEQYGNRIVTQMKRLGSSCDWDREAFTMDDNLSKAVRKVFINLYDKGLIYQGDRIINWCPSCKTALSDAEVEYQEQASYLWHIRYPLADGEGGVVVATTRPETMLGDTAVAVHPDDPRYKDLVGKELILPLVNKRIPIVADEYVEMDFGSGAVKITPAHDPNDYEVGKRHNLPVIRVMNDDGTMNDVVEAYAGLDRFEARKRIEEDLRAGGYLVEKEPYTHNVGTCYRCHSTGETIISRQWFVRMEPLAAPAIEAVRKKETRFVPDRFSKIYFNWMCNIKDWCISRQLWWGHRIPAYYCADCGATYVAEEAPKQCKCGCTSFRQDEDVLDTWFSSALWPFSTLGWPEKTPSLDYFYPNSVLVTAYDIIFFWVARMIFSGLENMGEVPFKDVLIHGIVRDEQGRKMSKSLGNGIDPLEVIDNYGADGLRFSLANGIAPGSDTRFSKDRIESCRNFINKVWNASRFVMMNAEGVEVKPIDEVKKTMADKWILSKLNKVIGEVSRNLDKYEIGIAAGKLYDYVWGDFCDWYLELVKPVLYGEDAEAKRDTVSVLVYVLSETLKLLHPYIPFVTEYLYRNLPGAAETIMREPWPKADRKYAYREAAKQMEGVMEIVSAIRNVRAEVGVAPSKKVHLMVVTAEAKTVDKCRRYVEKLAGVESITFIDKKDVPQKVSSKVTTIAELYIPLGDLVDTDKEIARLEAEKAKLQKEIDRSQGMLANAGFVARAPQAVVDKEKAALALNLDKMAKLDERIASLK